MYAINFTDIFEWLHITERANQYLFIYLITSLAYITILDFSLKLNWNWN